MNFNSYSFAIFFAAVLALHSMRLPWSLRKFNLLLCSYIFYAAWRAPFVVLIWISTIIDWYASQMIFKSESRAAKRAFLLLSLLTNLGLLGYFKYAQFLWDNSWQIFSMLGFETGPIDWGIILPVGISFYTFQTLSYTIDIYRGKSKPWHSFLDYALYVTFFPQLVAGPIVRSSDFLPQCVEPRRGNAAQISWGFVLIVIGLFEKRVVADGLLAPLSDKAFNDPAALGFLDAWFGVFSFAGQVFGDFAGYSTIAIGVALCLGFTFQDNFHFPYAAIGFSDFWQRWHISLSSWLRDYLYIPLGGNRKGAVRTYVNLMLTMLLGGLWHGASWTFVVWGGLHGIYLVIERLLKNRLGHWEIWRVSIVRIGLAILTYLLVCLTWVFFRAQDFTDAMTFAKTMVSFNNGIHHAVIKSTEIVLVSGVTLTMLSLHWLLRDSSIEEAAQRLPWWMRGLILAGMMVAIVTMSGDNIAFIYFIF